MGTSNFSDEFKRDAVHQITVRRCPVQEVSRRLGVSTYSLYKRRKPMRGTHPCDGMCFQHLTRDTCDAHQSRR